MAIIIAFRAGEAKLTPPNNTETPDLPTEPQKTLNLISCMTCQTGLHNVDTETRARLFKTTDVVS